MGGTSTNVTFNEDYSIEEIDAKVKPVVSGSITGDANIQTTEGNTVPIRLSSRQENCLWMREPSLARN